MKIGDTDEIIAITKNGVQRLSSAPTPDIAEFKSDKKITDEEILAILEQPLAKAISAKPKKAKKKKSKKAKKPAEAKPEAEEEDDDDEDEDDDDDE